MDAVVLIALSLALLGIVVAAIWVIAASLGSGSRS
jgi:hypothetical protein